MKDLTPQPTAQFLIYKSDNQDVRVDVLLQDENIWLTQEQMAQLFGKAKSTINMNILKIFLKMVSL